jgi:serine phosphatase RsbU (regulator of sigma subunit)
VPFTARDTVLGVVVFVRTDNAAPFCQADLELAEGLAERAALILDNARRYSREHAASHALQRNLLPHRLDGRKAVEIATRYLRSGRRGGVGGDWYDAIPLPGDRVALVVGDVVGHGISAAATMGQLRTAVIAFTNLGLSPAEVLTQLDQLAMDLTRDRHESDLTTACATCIYAVYEPATRRCTLASAGHPPPAVVLRDGSAAFVDLTPGAPIGVGLLDYESVEIDVPEGSVTALYTYGLVESRTADIDEGMRRLRTALGGPARDLEEFASGVLDAMRGPGCPEDDIAPLIARTR